MQTKNFKFSLTPVLILFYLSILFYSCGGYKNTKYDNVDYQLYQLYYENSSGENGLTTFDYSDEGILEKGNFSK